MRLTAGIASVENGNLSSREVLILAGGLGTRLRPVVGDRPKPVAEVAGRPFIEHLLEQLLHFRYERAILCVGYLADQVRLRLGGRFGALTLVYSVEESPLGTAGALARASELVECPDVLVMNGDSFCEMDLTDFDTAHRRLGGDATIAVLHRDDRSRAGAVEMDTTNRITSFSARPVTASAGLINAGVYMFRTEIIRALPKGKLSLEEDVFPSMAEQGKLFGWQAKSGFIDIGTPETYRTAQIFFRRT